MTTLFFNHVQPRRLLTFLIIASAPFLAAAGDITNNVNKVPADLPVLSVLVDHPIVVLDDRKGRTASATLKVIPQRFPANAKLIYSWKQIQDTMSPIAANMASHPIEFSDPKAEATTVTFREWGVYAVRVTVTDSTHGNAATRNAWISVWDNRSHIIVDGKPDPLAVAPGITPPPHVRDLSPDPGPYYHPRLFCTDADWKEIHERCVEGKGILAGNAYRNLSVRIAKLGDLKTKEGRWMASLEAYANSGYRPSALPNLATGAEVVTGTSKGEKRKIDLAEQAVDAIAQTLADACFAQWIKTDPSTPHSQISSTEKAMNLRLAKLVAAFCRASLVNSWDRETGVFHKGAPGYLTGIDGIGASCSLRDPLALAYDFISPWMNEEQLRDCRNLMFATGVGRMTTCRGSAFAHNGVADYHGIPRGYQQPGNFASFSEGEILKALVVAGEEGGADPKVLQTFLNPPVPKDFKDLTKVFAYDWVRPVDEDSGRKCPVSQPYDESMSWPNARKVDADNLLRGIFWNQDGMVTPWGFLLEREAYHSTCGGQWISALVYARFGAHNQFVTGYFYNNINHYLNNQYAYGEPLRSPHFTANIQSFNHHAGAGAMGLAHIRLLKYMYPDDPAVDYFYAVRAPELEKRGVDMETCIFGLDPNLRETRNAMGTIAQAKQLPLTKLDPEEGVVVMRSGWGDDAVMIDFDDGWKGCGHMNAEKNSFALFALGRSWALPVGYHKVYSCWQASVQAQNPAWASCPVTQGYFGVNPNFPPDVLGSNYKRSFPTPPGKLLEVKEASDQSWCIAAGDASLAYNYMCSTEGKRLGIPRAQAMYPGLLPDLIQRCPLAKELFVDCINGAYHNYDLYLIPSPLTAVKMATRTILMSRGKRPYVLIIDDFRKGDAPANYRWMFNNHSRSEDGKRSNTGDFLMTMEPGATATEAVLYHTNDRGNEPGKPRLLVRDVSEANNAKQPAIRMDQTKFKAPHGLESDYYLNEDSNRVLIERDQVVDPKFKVLLFPFRTGEAFPKTSWNADHTELTINTGENADILKFSVNPSDHRTRVELRHAPR